MPLQKNLNKPKPLAPNERVLVDEFEKAVIAEAEFFGRFAELWTGGTGKAAS
jgi:hypothetical protein